MAHAAGTLVQQSATNPGTGTFSLAAAATDRQDFVTAVGNGNTCFYVAIGAEGSEWGIGTVASGTPDTLARTTVIYTTDGSTAKLNFTGAVEIFQGLPSEYGIFLDPAGNAGPILPTYNSAATRLSFNETLRAPGLLFGSDTAAANTLDDYEEGQTTSMKIADAASSGTESSTTVTCRYTKIGRIVICAVSATDIDIVTAGLTGGQDLYFTGLPFVAAGATWGGSVRMDQITYSDYVVPFLASGTDYFRLAEVRSAAATDFITCGEVGDDTGDVNILLVYEAA